MVSKSDADHIKRILTDGCPADFDFKEPHDNKMLLLERGNEPSIDMHIDAVNEMLNKASGKLKECKDLIKEKTATNGENNSAINLGD